MGAILMKLNHQVQFASQYNHLVEYSVQTQDGILPMDSRTHAMNQDAQLACHHGSLDGINRSHSEYRSLRKDTYMKHAARRPKPPLPKAISGSSSQTSLMSRPSSFNASRAMSNFSRLVRLLTVNLPIKNSADK